MFLLPDSREGHPSHPLRASLVCSWLAAGNPIDAKDLIVTLLLMGYWENVTHRREFCTNIRGAARISEGYFAQD